MAFAKSTPTIFKHVKTAVQNLRNHAQKSNTEMTLTQLKDNDRGIAVIGMNNAKKRNAFSMQMVDELSWALYDVSIDSSTRVLLIRSLVPGIFCAGADLKERAMMTERQVAQFVTSLRSLMSRVQNLSIPVISVFDGAAFGGGLELGLACDMRIASMNAKLGLVETKLAIMPGAGGTQRLSRLINPSVAKELIFTARVFDGKEAKDLGVVNHVVEQNDNGDAAYLKSLEIAREILPNGPIGVKMAKAAINKGLEVDLNTGLAFEEAYYAQIIPTKDRVEGLAAFNEKRTPKYTGE